MASALAAAPGRASVLTVLDNSPSKWHRSNAPWRLENMTRIDTSTDGEPGAPRHPAEWLVAAYSPVTMFSLRMTHATSKGGKTLVVPTPYAVKMALLDVCFRRFT